MKAIFGDSFKKLLKRSDNNILIIGYSIINVSESDPDMLVASEMFEEIQAIWEAETSTLNLFLNTDSIKDALQIGEGDDRSITDYKSCYGIRIYCKLEGGGNINSFFLKLEEGLIRLNSKNNIIKIKFIENKVNAIFSSRNNDLSTKFLESPGVDYIYNVLYLDSISDLENGADLISLESYNKYLANKGVDYDYKFTPWINKLGESQTENYTFRIYEAEGFDAGVSDMRKNIDDGILTKYHLFRDRDGIVKVRGVIQYTEYNVNRGVITEVSKGTESISGIDGIEIICDKASRKFRYTIDNSLYNIKYKECNSICVNSEIPYGIFHLKLSFLNEFTNETVTVESNKFELRQTGNVKIFNVKHNTSYSEDSIPVYLLNYTKDDEISFEIDVFTDEDEESIRNNLYCLYENDSISNGAVVNGIYADYMNNIFSVNYNISRINSDELRIVVTLKTLTNNEDENHWRPFIDNASIPVLTTLKLYANDDIYDTKFYMIQKANTVPIEIHDNNITRTYNTTSVGKVSIPYQDSNKFYIDNTLSLDSEVKITLSDFPNDKVFYFKLKNKVENLTITINDDDTYTYEGEFDNDFIFIKYSKKSPVISNRVQIINTDSDEVNIVPKCNAIKNYRINNIEDAGKLTLNFKEELLISVYEIEIKNKIYSLEINDGNFVTTYDKTIVKGTVVYSKWINSDGDYSTLIEVAPANYSENEIIFIDPFQEEKVLAISNKTSLDEEGNIVTHEASSDTYWRVIENKIPVTEEYLGRISISLDTNGSPEYQDANLKFSTENGEINTVIPDYETYINDDGTEEIREITWPSQYKTFKVTSTEVSTGVQDTRLSYLKFLKLSTSSFPERTEDISLSNWRVAALSAILNVLVIRKGQDPFIKLYDSSEATEEATRIYVKKVDCYPINVRSNIGVKASFQFDSNRLLRTDYYKECIRFFGEIIPGKITTGYSEYIEKKNNSETGVNVYINNTVVQKYSTCTYSEDGKYKLGTITFEDIYNQSARKSIEIWQDLDFDDYLHSGDLTDDTIRFYKHDENSHAIEFYNDYNSIGSHILFTEDSGKGVFYIKSSSYVTVVDRYKTELGTCTSLGERLYRDPDYSNISVDYRGTCDKKERGTLKKDVVPTTNKDSRGQANKYYDVGVKYYYLIWPKFHVNDEGIPEYLRHEVQLETSSYDRSENNEDASKYRTNCTDLIKFWVDYKLYGCISNKDELGDSDEEYSRTEKDLSYYVVRYPIPKLNVVYNYSWPDWDKHGKKKYSGGFFGNNDYAYILERKDSHRSLFGELSSPDEASYQMLWTFPRHMSSYPLRYYNGVNYNGSGKMMNRRRVNVAFRINAPDDFKRIRVGTDYFNNQETRILYKGEGDSSGVYTKLSPDDNGINLKGGYWIRASGGVINISESNESGIDHWIVENNKTSRMHAFVIQICDFKVDINTSEKQIKEGVINIFGTIKYDEFKKYYNDQNILPNTNNLTESEILWIRGLIYERYNQVRIILRQQDNVYYELGTDGVLTNINVIPRFISECSGGSKKNLEFYLNISEGNEVQGDHKFSIGDAIASSGESKEIPGTNGGSFSCILDGDTTERITVYDMGSRLQKNIYDLADFEELSTPLEFPIKAGEAANMLSQVGLFYQNGVKNALLYSGEKVKNALFIGSHTDGDDKYIIKEDVNSLDDVFEFKLSELIKQNSSTPISDVKPELYIPSVNYPNNNTYPYINKNALELDFRTERFYLSYASDAASDAYAEVFKVEDAAELKVMESLKMFENKSGVILKKKHLKYSYYFLDDVFENTVGVVLDLPSGFKFKYYETYVDYLSETISTLDVENTRRKYFYYYDSESESFLVKELNDSFSDEYLLTCVKNAHSGNNTVKSTNNNIKITRLTSISPKLPTTYVDYGENGSVKIKFQKNEISEVKVYQFKVELDSANVIDDEFHTEEIDSSFVLELTQSKFSIDFSYEDDSIGEDYVWNFYSDGTSLENKNNTFKFKSNNEFLENSELLEVVDTSGELLKTYFVSLSDSDYSNNTYTYEVRFFANSRLNKDTSISGTLEFHYLANGENKVIWEMKYNQGYTCMYLKDRITDEEFNVEVPEREEMIKYNVGISYLEFATKNSEEPSKSKKLLTDQSVFVQGDYNVDEDYFNVIGYHYDSLTKKYKFHEWDLGQYVSNIDSTSVSLIKEENYEDYEEYSIADSISKTSDIKVKFNVTTHLVMTYSYLEEYNPCLKYFLDNQITLTLKRNYKNI